MYRNKKNASELVQTFKIEKAVVAFAQANAKANSDSNKWISLVISRFWVCSYHEALLDVKAIYFDLSPLIIFGRTTRLALTHSSEGADAEVWQVFFRILLTHQLQKTYTCAPSVEKTW